MELVATFTILEALENWELGQEALAGAGAG